MGTKSTINPLDILYFINFMDNDIFSLSKLSNLFLIPKFLLLQ